MRFIAKELDTKLQRRRGVGGGEEATGVAANGSIASLDARDAKCKSGHNTGAIREPCDNERRANTSGARNKRMYYRERHCRTVKPFVSRYASPGCRSRTL